MGKGKDGGHGYTKGQRQGGATGRRTAASSAAVTKEEFHGEPKDGRYQGHCSTCGEIPHKARLSSPKKKRPSG